MKVIDLLNKIASRKGLPDKIRLECVNSINEHNCFYHFSPIFESYINDDNTLIQNATNLATLLDLEVEIIEEDKKIQLLPIIDGWCEDIPERNQVRRKVNEIIEYINEEK